MNLKIGKKDVTDLTGKRFLKFFTLIEYLMDILN
jgi:hypothetical protein